MALQHLRSSTANKRPVPGNMSDGQIAINTNTGSPGLFFKDSNNTLVKVGPVHVGTTAPNASPASGGTAGNSVGEQWLDTSGGTYVFKVWDGSAWRSSDVMTGALGIIAGSAAAPGLYFSGDTNTGLYSPGADQVAISTGGSGRLFVDASGTVEVIRNNNVSVECLTITNQATSGAANASFQNFKTFTGSSVAYAAAIGATASTWSYGNSQPNSFIIQGYGAGGVGIRAANAPIIFSNGNADPHFSTERLRITSAGLVGVGTSVPGTKVEIVDGTDNNHLTLYKTGVAGGAGPGIRFNNQNNTGGSAYIAAITTELTSGTPSQEAGALVLSTRSTSDATPQKRIYVSATGQVGIGATNPGAPLHVVAGANARGIRISAALNNSAAYLTFNDDLQNETAFIGNETRTGTAGQLVFGANGTERARIDSSGRLLVGTSTTSGVARTVIQGYVGDNNGLGLLQLQVGSTSPGFTLGRIDFTDSNSNAGARFLAERDGGTWTSGSSHPTRLVFSTCGDGASSPTERMRIDSTGRCFFNTTASPSTSSFGTAIGTVLAHSRDTSTGAVAQIYGSAGEFRIIGSGNAQNTNNSYGAISDQSLKTDISDAGSQWDDIKGITVRKFKLIGTDTLQIGVVAQECELVSPGLVEDTVLEQEDGTTSTVKAVKYSVLYMKAVKALQEAMERIEQLEQRLAAAGI